MKINSLVIDTTTSSKDKLIKRLRAQATTSGVTDAGAYRQDETLSMIRVSTTLDEYEMEAWLYEEKGIDYLGVTVEGESTAKTAANY
jgi:hypothetical protein